MRLGTVKNLATKYYKFILKYEETISKVEPILSSKLSERDLKQYEYIKNKQKKKFQPWNFLEKGLSKESIIDLFIESSQELMNFVIAEDGLHEQLYIFGYAELEAYYKENGIDKEPEEISEEIQRYEFDKSLNEHIFSKELISIFNLHKEIHSLASRVHNLYQKRNSERIMSHEKAKELAKIFCDFISEYDKDSLEKINNIKNIVSKEENAIIGILNEYFIQEYEPWRLLSKKTEMESITEIFEFDFEESIRYCKMYEMFSDEYTFTGVEELEKFYKEKRINKSSEDLFDEMSKYEETGKIDKTIFSKGVIDNFNNMMKLKPIYDVLEKIQKENFEKNHPKVYEDIEEDITDSR